MKKERKDLIIGHVPKLSNLTKQGSKLGFLCKRNHKSLRFTKAGKGPIKFISTGAPFDLNPGLAVDLGLIPSRVKPMPLNMVFTSGVRTGGGRFRGSKPLPIGNWKKLKTALFGPISVFSYRDCVFCAVSNCLYNLEKLSL